MRKYLLSVSEFALPSPLRGSIDYHSGFSDGRNLGIQIHKEVQNLRAKSFPTYQSEVGIEHEFNYKKCSIGGGR